MSNKLWLFPVVCLIFVLAACGGRGQPAPAPEAPAPQEAQAPAPAEPAAPAAEAAAPSQYQESPILAEKVAAGELPPVDERLPNEPFVVGPGVLLSEEDLPNWQPGRYGGTLRSAHFRPEWNPDIFVMTNEPLLIAQGISVNQIKGNVVRDFEVNEDNTEFTFYMREGLKWSDGEPVTTEDVRFTYEDILLNENLTPTFPRRFRTGFDPAGEPMTLEIIDDYTFKISFPEPYGGLLRAITIEGWNGYTELLRPAHYLKQFHADYTPLEELRPLLDEQGLKDEWWQLFTNMQCLNWDNTEPRCADFPVLNPWIVTKSTEPGLLVFERNPYYFKVDTEGKQLPYIDKIISPLVEDVEMVNLKILTGDVDFMRESTGLVKVPLYKENEEKGGFTTVLLDMHVDSTCLEFNRTFDDPEWRQISEDIRFHQAASLAINRDEIIESIYYGFASLPLKTVGEELSVRDLDRANALLDELGLTERNSEGYRLGPDGQVFSILLEHGAHAPDIGPVAELISQHLKDVGLQVQVKPIDPQLWSQKRAANELQATVFWCHDQGWDNNWTGDTIERAGRLWFTWFTTQGQEGEEPPAWAKRAFELDAQRWSVVSGSDEYNQLKEEGYAWHRENLPIITIVENVKYPLIVSSRFGNVPSAGYAIAANFAGEQLFFTSD